MSKRHHRDSPVLKDYRELYLRDHVDIAPIQVDTPEWFAWLAIARRFSVITAKRDLTARREKRGTGYYWYLAAADRTGMTRKAYLGKSEVVTGARVRAVSERLLRKL